MKSGYLDQAMQLVFQELTGIIQENEFTEYSARKIKDDKETQTIYRVFEGEKLSRLALEQYSIKSKMYGLVVNIYSKPGFGIPIFTFQLGGQIPDRIIFVLDIIPVCNKAKVNQLVNVLFKQECLKYENLGSNQEWLAEITSPNMLVCQYKACDPLKLIESLRNYLRFWRDNFYKPAIPLTDNDIKAESTESLLHYKRVLHANDSGFDIYLKNFGQAMVDVIAQAAFGGEPALESTITASDPVTETTPGLSVESEGIKWTTEAMSFLEEAPGFVRSKIKEKAEAKAKEMGLHEITPDLIASLRK